MKEVEGVGDVDEPVGGHEAVGGHEPGGEPRVGPGLPAGRALLRAELLALGRGLDVPATDGLTMAERVMAQLVAEGVPVPAPEPASRAERAWAWLRGRARLLGAALCGLLVVLVLTPPVRATVADWFAFGGFEVRYTPAAPPPVSASDPPAGPGAPGPACGAPERIRDAVPLAEAARRAGFRPVVPARVGADRCWMSEAGAREGKEGIGGAPRNEGFPAR